MKKDELSDTVVQLFNENQQVYGARKLKVELAKKNFRVSRPRIVSIMRANGLVSVYTIKKYRPHPEAINEKHHPNGLDHQCNEKERYEVVVSDLTYVRVDNQ